MSTDDCDRILTRGCRRCSTSTIRPTTDPRDFLGAQYDAGLAWVHLPLGFGGLDLPRTAQEQVDAKLAAAGAPVGGTAEELHRHGHGGADDRGVRDR